MAAKYVNKYRAMPVQAKASFWFLICAFLQRGISAITTPIFTRLMTTFEYGQYSVFTSWMSIAACFITCLLYTSLVFAEVEVIYRRSMKNMEAVC